ncbi:MAG: 2-C-methyl-D-erythritol 2,4-cyclodiphosphate synthase [Candidatus Omnitrophica bacterium]|nr:2-C-methyl-D-erythritol 2,4-cyclodiphosphate synthase [Candidatus Omnitrophota bacterium]
MFRVGMGYDVHGFVAGRKLILGGVEIPHPLGLDGHSDADVLLHAICDALLGAVGQGDIGEHFPNTDEQYRNISSLKLLSQVRKIVEEAGYLINNVDAVILVQEPSLKSFKPQIRKKIAEELKISEGDINIKATTNEGLGFVGRKEGIAAYAVVSLLRNKN